MSGVAATNGKRRRLSPAPEPVPIASRVPPHDLDAEAAVLSASILSPDAFGRVRAIVSPAHFYSEANRRIFEAVVGLHAVSKPVDLVTVMGWLRDHDRLAQVGGSPYLAQIIDATPAVANVATHAARVRELAEQRVTLATAQALTAAIYSGDESAAAKLRADLSREVPTSSVAVTPERIVQQWRNDGPLVRVPTGIEPLDRLSRGGLAVPWRVIIVGAPAAGKTAVAMCMADTMAAGLCVGIVAVDEEPEDLTVRLLQIAGFSVAQTELRDPEQLTDMAEALESMPVRFYDSTWHIETAAADLAAWAKREGRRAVLTIDSLQAATSGLGADAKSAREHVEANVQAMRLVSTHYRMLVIATSEANRASYRSDDAADTTNDMAAGAESRAIEFGAQTQLMLRTPKDHPEIIHVRIAKNRRADRGEFWLRLDRDGHAVTECPNPDADPSVDAGRREHQRAAVRGEVLRDAEALAALLVRHPSGLGERDLRAKLKSAGHKWGRERLDAARDALANGHKGVRVVDAAPDEGGRRCWKLEPTSEPKDAP